MKLDPIGEVYNRWTIIGLSHRTPAPGYAKIFSIRCQCGRYGKASLASLRSGITKSCGCLRSELNSKRLMGHAAYNAKPKGESSLNQLYGAYRRQAQGRNLPFELSKEEFKNITSQTCHYCAKAPSSVCRRLRINGDYVYNGIDRRDNRLGYTISNSLPCCKFCNVAKSDYSYEEFLSFIKNIFAVHFKGVL